MYIAQIAYLLAAKLISSSANRSLCVCPLLEAERALQEADGSRWSWSEQRVPAPGISLRFE